MEQRELSKLFEHWAGSKPSQIEALAPSGSDRKYYRLIDQNYSAIGVENENIEENSRFCYFAKLFKSEGIHVPQIYAVSANSKFYLQEDLGAISLIDVINLEKANNTFPSEGLKKLYKSAIDQIVHLHYKVHERIDYGKCSPKSEFDLEMVGWDLNYFKYCFLKTQFPDLNHALLESEFSRLKERIEEIPQNSFMYRDFQSRNIMIKNDEVYLIDFQGGLKGPGIYDIASLTFQARAGLPEELKLELIEYYFQKCKSQLNISKEKFNDWLNTILILRITQTLGAYGFRGLFQKKESFIRSIPPAISNLNNLLNKSKLESGFPYLFGLTKKLNKKYNQPTAVKTDKLNVKISSFSYKIGGIPTDTSGNGGGFVFDCRGLLNPGRFEEYRKLTGMDKSVIEFLENKTEADSFIENSLALVAPTIENYVSRGFDSLMISFGCTGGQHRSVYCAESVYRALNKDSRISVQLEHIEQGISK